MKERDVVDDLGVDGIINLKCMRRKNQRMTQVKMFIHF